MTPNFCNFCKYMIITKILFMKIFICHNIINISTRYYSYKLAIKSVSLFKYFKSSSLFCNICNSLNLHFTFAAFNSGSSKGKACDFSKH